MQAVSRKYYRVFVPTALAVPPSELTVNRGSMPIYRRVRELYFATGNTRTLQILGVDWDEVEERYR